MLKGQELLGKSKLGAILAKEKRILHKIRENIADSKRIKNGQKIKFTRFITTHTHTQEEKQ